jgi:dimethylamine--corrinoid protein Co-methyltransferase
VGVGDPYGMHAAHAIVSGMGGIRTAGDLVARLQLNRAMRIDEAKKYVADKLGASVADIADEVKMREVREDMDLGTLNECPGVAKGIDAKFRIAKLMDLNINSVELFKQRVSFDF